MNKEVKSFPLGTLPYNSVDTAAVMLAKLYSDSPYLAILPAIDSEDTVINRTLKGIPGVKFKDGKLLLKTTSKQYQAELTSLDKAFNSAKKDDVDKFAIESIFLEKYFQLIKKFKSKTAYVNILGPFTLSQLLNNLAEEQMLTDKSFRKLFIQAVCVKAMYMIKKIKETCPTTQPIIVLEEPMLGRFGDIKRINEDITAELITNMFTRVIEKIKECGALVCVQCMEKCDWQIPINAGADIISYDAYNNPNNLCIIPESVTEFIERGGKINWGIVPTMTESIVKTLTIDYIEKRLSATFGGLIMAGVPAVKVYSSALVSVQGDTGHLPVIFAEKAIMLSTQMASRLSAKGF